MQVRKARKKIFAINGSAGKNSANQKIIRHFAALTDQYFDLTIFNELNTLPHFDPELSLENTPEEILNFRNEIRSADGLLICTPEYVFSIPGGLKNAIEWCVSTTVFSDKPTGLITASANGQKGHEELQLIMETLMARLTPGASLLIQGVKGKINGQGEITDEKTNDALMKFIEAFRALI